MTTQAVQRGWRLGDPGPAGTRATLQLAWRLWVWVEIGLGWRHQSRPPKIRAE